MMCRCKHCGAILAVVILVFSFWNFAWTSWLTSKWIIVVAAAVILLHDLMHAPMGMCGNVKKAPMQKKAKKSARRRKRR